MDRVTRINMLVNNTGFMLGTDDLQWVTLIVNNTPAFNRKFYARSFIHTRTQERMHEWIIRTKLRHATLLHSSNSTLQDTTVQ
jgi:hypothetical protein